MLWFRLQEGLSRLNSLPNRTLDLLNLHQSDTDTESGHQYLALDRVSYLVIDEADRMLDISSSDQSHSLLHNS